MRTLIQNGRIIDGSGSPACRADLVIDDDRITAVISRDRPRTEQPNRERHLIRDRPGPDSRATCAADRVIDASGLTVAPGFIDGHRHGDLAVLTDPEFGEIELAQGITSVVNGNCGMSLFPSAESTRQDWHRFLEPCLGKAPPDLSFDGFAAYRDAVADAALRINVGTLAGTGAIRIAVKGFTRAPYTASEMSRARSLLDQSLREGAAGASAGIMYVPECHTTPEEYRSLLQPLAAQDALLSCHIRGEGNSLVQSVDEILAICRAIGIRLNISHFKAVGINNWRRLIHQAIERIEQSDSDVTVDFYPYLGGSTTLMTLLPPTVIQDSLPETLRLLTQSGGIARVRAELEKTHPGWDSMVEAVGWERIIISSVGNNENKELIGLNLAEIARLSGSDPVRVMCELLTSEKGNVGIISMSMAQEDLDTIARLPWSMVISDSLYGRTERPHPRMYGAFSRVIRDMVMDRKILSLEQAVCKMTSQPAARYGLEKRGRIQEGWFADLCLFDPQAVQDHAAYQEPKRLAGGMELVLVNGRIAWLQGKLAGSAQGGNTGRILIRKKIS